MVFVHGLGGNHAVWFHQIAHFARNHTVVTMSQRGFAPSGGTQDRYNVDLLVDDLIHVMDDAKIERAAVIGQSMGGWTALGLATRAPERVDSLVLADTIAGISDDEIREHMRRVTESAARLGNAAPPLGVHPALSEGFTQQRPDLAYLYQTLNAFGAPPPGTIAGQLAAAQVPAEQLASMRVPTLLVVGTEDRLFSPALIRRASGYIPGSRVVEIGNAGHSPYFEQPEAWNSAVEEFVDRHTPSQ